jgi:hypothetical protein
MPFNTPRARRVAFIPPATTPRRSAAVLTKFPRAAAWRAACSLRAVLGCDQRPDPDVVKEVLAYFVRHPHAADDLEGVARWRLLEAAVRTRVDETHDALEWLTARGFLERVTRPGSATVFRLNAGAADAVRRFLEAGASSGDPAPGADALRACAGRTADPSQGEICMPATLTNKSRSLVTVELKSGEWIHLAPGETSGPIDDVEVHQNDRLGRLVDRKLITLGRPDAERTAAAEERPRERTPKR